MIVADRVFELRFDVRSSRVEYWWRSNIHKGARGILVAFQYSIEGPRWLLFVYWVILFLWRYRNRNCQKSELETRPSSISREYVVLRFDWVLLFQW